MDNNQNSHDIIHYIRDMGALTLIGDGLPYWQNLFRWQQEAQGSMPLTSWRALQYDWKQFLTFCNRYDLTPLPASPETIRLYLLSMTKPLDTALRTEEDDSNLRLIEAELKNAGIAFGEPKKMATIERRASTLSKAHRAAKCLNPVDTETVNSALKKIRRVTDREQTQRRPIRHIHYTTISCLEHENYRDQQDVLITLIGFETGLRRHRLASIHLQNIEFTYDIKTEDSKKIETLSGALLTIRKDKNQTEDKIKAITPATAQLLKDWLFKAEISTGPIFRGIIGRGNSKACIQEKAISGQSVLAAMQRCMRRIGESDELIGGHSTRIGGILFLREKKVDHTTQIAFGDWKGDAMLLRYTKELDAKQSTMVNLLK